MGARGATKLLVYLTAIVVLFYFFVHYLAVKGRNFVSFDLNLQSAEIVVKEVNVDVYDDANGSTRKEESLEADKTGKAHDEEEPERLEEILQVTQVICHKESEKGSGWFRHCQVPDKESARARINGYVLQRMENYTGKCHEDVLQFHCLEFAARMRWCDWSKMAPFKPPPQSAYLNPAVCESIINRPAVSSGRGKDGYMDDHKLVFFYPSYSHVNMLNRSISALQHPNHVFLIQIDAEPPAEAEFVQGILSLAASYDSVCVAQWGRVLYTTSAQILIAYPAFAWADQIQGWTHFLFMGAQDYPTVPLEHLRRFSWVERENMVFPFSPPQAKNLWRRYTEDLPLCFGYHTKNHNWGEKVENMGSWVDDRGVVHPDPQGRDIAHVEENHIGKPGWTSRIDWLSLQVEKEWLMLIQGGVNVMFISNIMTKFLLHDARARMWLQYFSYMMIGCEHFFPSVTFHYFPERISEQVSCFMTWDNSVENVVLNNSHWPLLAGHGLFARKFKLPVSEALLGRVDRELRVQDRSRKRPWHFLLDSELRRRALKKKGGKGQPKVAFLFLLTEELPLAAVWGRYLKGHGKKFNVYLHATPGYRPDRGSRVLNNRLIPSQAWTRGTFSTVSAMLRLIHNALMDDADNQRFIFMLPGFIPVRSFNSLRHLLLETHPEKSFLSLSFNASLSRRNAALRPLVPEESFAKGSPFFALTREHARMVAEDDDIQRAFRFCMTSPEDPMYFCSQEEHYIQTLLAMKDLDNVARLSVVRQEFYTPTDIVDQTVLERIRRGGDHIMFAGAFTKSCGEAILEMSEEELGY